jgi:HD-GYP domain-containing protein (c-di-GMP phosphodiesterase class II)
MIKSVKESPKLNNLLSFLFTSKISYAYQHAHMVTVICHYILSKLEISKPAHLDLLSFISFFSDITLKSRTQIEINSLDDLEQSGLDGEEKLAVTYHARDAAKLMQSHPEAPQGIDKLIIQHHGRLDGVGFEANPPEEIHNLIKIYMVADAFVKFALKPGAFKNKGELIDAIKKNFQSESFAKIIKVLESKIE